MAKTRIQSFYCRVPAPTKTRMQLFYRRVSGPTKADMVIASSGFASGDSDAIIAVGPAGALNSMVLDGLAKGKINDWPPEARPLLRLLRSRKPVPHPLPLDLVPLELRAVFGFPVSFPKKEEKALAVAKFIEERMPLGPTRKGVPKNVIADAKKKFGLSVRAVQRAFHRGKKRNKVLELLGLEYPRALP
jgi:hypothetical protein